MILIVLPEKGSRPTIFPTPPVRSLDFGIFSPLLSYGFFERALRSVGPYVKSEGWTKFAIEGGPSRGERLKRFVRSSSRTGTEAGGSFLENSVGDGIGSSRTECLRISSAGDFFST